MEISYKWIKENLHPMPKEYIEKVFGNVVVNAWTEYRITDPLTDKDNEISIGIPTSSAVYLELSNGRIIEITNSEWMGIQYLKSIKNE